MEQASAIISNKFSFRISLENFYNKFQLIKLALSIYLLSLIIAFWHKRSFIYTALIANIILISSLIIRILITNRPPISSLYESLIFVATIFALIPINYKNIREVINQRTKIITISFLLAISYIFKDHENNFALISAILNTDFWLTIHVITIMLGYSMTIITSLYGHYQLMKFPKNQHLTKSKIKIIYKLLALSLLLTISGTILGGFWADYSWGRFWGWDPKENGALLIVFALLIILHATFAGYLKNQNLLTALISLNIIVIFSWLGVNLLNTGLHAYGFTNLGLMLFIIFITAEISFIGYYRYLRK